MPLSLIESHIRYFADFESREAAFNRLVADLIPCRYGGPVRFWRDFSQIVDHLGVAREGLEVAYITSNPADCLAFGTPWQVLSAARMTAMEIAPGGLPGVEHVARVYDVAEHLDQPIRSLSGGETVKLALAKAALASQTGWNLVVASPFCWLAKDNLPLLKRLVDQYRRQTRSVSILALAGENDDASAGLDPSTAGPESCLRINIATRGVTVRLGAETPGFGRPPAVARIADVDLHLMSPLLLVGDNGQGKSVFAKAAAGALPSVGRLRMGSTPGGGRVRLLFQDVITQTFLRRSAALTATLSPQTRQQAFALEAQLENAYELYRGGVPQADPITAQDGPDNIDGGPQSLLGIKLALVAVRMVGDPGALILDEPDWGLSRPDAVAFVAAVIQVAHRLNVPVVLISHKNWWATMAASRVAVRKQTIPGGPDQGMQILLSLEQLA